MKKCYMILIVFFIFIKNISSASISPFALDGFLESVPEEINPLLRNCTSFQESYKTLALLRSLNKTYRDSFNDSFICKKLTQIDLNINERNSEGKTLLQEALAKGNLKLVRTLFKEFKVKLDEPNIFLEAAKYASPKVLDALLSDPDIKDFIKVDTFLCNETTEEARMRSIFDALKDNRNALRQNVLHLAASRGDEKILIFFLKMISFKSDPSRVSAFKADGSTISDLLLDKDANENTPLHLAVASGKIEAVKAICSCVDINKIKVNKSDMLPFHIAVDNDFPEALAVLTAHGFDINKPIEMYINRPAQPPLMHMVEGYGSMRTTPLGDHYPRGVSIPQDVQSFKTHLKQKVDLLIAAGANIDGTDSEGNTALINKVKSLARHRTINGLSYFIEALLACGANPHKKNNAGESALDIAKQSAAPNHELIHLLDPRNNKVFSPPHSSIAIPEIIQTSLGIACVAATVAYAGYWAYLAKKWIHNTTPEDKMKLYNNSFLTFVSHHHKHHFIFWKKRNLKPEYRSMR